MCGFTACLSLDGSPPVPVVDRMLPTIVARGPDDSGTWHRDNLAFGFRRLSIIDLTAGGHQPMVSADRQLCLVFNGEIYNYLEIRRELQQLGHVFRSASDSEVLLHAYQQWGERCVERFLGMWAFLISDASRGILFGSRDRFGIKPLYSARSGGQLLLASEIKAIRAALPTRPSINWSTTAGFLLHGRLDETTDSFFDGITSVPAAHSFSVNTLTGETKQWRYWSPPASRESIDDAPDRFAALFADAMRLHARSDVPIAVHLSGGMDSTSIACGLADLRAQGGGEELNAICFVDPEFDEAEQIDATIARTGARLHKLSMSPEEIWKRLPEMLRAQDEPVHTMTPLVSYCLMDLTRQLGVKVVLNGAGADETLAGYTSYFRPFWREMLLGGRWRAMATQMSAHREMHGQSPARLIAREVRACAQSRLGALGAYQAAARLKARMSHDRWFTDGFAGEYGRPQWVPLTESLHEDLGVSITTNPLPLYLRIDDRNSMAHSIEERVPFLDHRLVELAFSVPASELLDGFWNKLLLRRAMSGRIPEVVRTRRQKFGFPTPASRWLRGPMSANARDLLTSLLPGSADVICGAEVLRDFDRFVDGEIDCGERLFRVLQFLLWRHEPMA